MPLLDDDMARFFDNHFDNICKIVTDWNDIESIIDIFVSKLSSPKGTYKFLSFLEHNFSEHPEKCLEWTIKIIDKQPTENTYSTHRLIDIMFNCYNTIRSYSKGNWLEENTMTKFDQILLDTEKSKTLIPYLNKLDE